MAEVLVYVDPDASGAGTGVDWTNAYTTLIACLAAEVTDLQTATDNYIIYCRSSSGTNDISAGTARTVSSTWNPSATYDLKIIVAESDRHEGVRSTGYILEQTVNWRGNLSVECDYVTVQGLAFKYGAGGVVFDGAHNCVCRDCFAYDGVGNAYHSKNDSATCDYINNGSVSAGGYGLYIESSGACNIYDNTFIKSGNDGIWLASYSNVVLRGNYLGDSTNEDIDDDSASTTRSNNATSDSTGDAGLQTIAVATASGAYFTNVTASSEDLNLTSSSSSLYGAGYNRSGEDYEGTTRAATPCIGFHEFVVSGGILLRTLNLMGAGR